MQQTFMLRKASRKAKSWFVSNIKAKNFGKTRSNGNGTQYWRITAARV